MFIYVSGAQVCVGGRSIHSPWGYSAADLPRHGKGHCRQEGLFLVFECVSDQHGSVAVYVSMSALIFIPRHCCLCVIPTGHGDRHLVRCG